MGINSQLVAKIQYTTELGSREMQILTILYFFFKPSRVVIHLNIDMDQGPWAHLHSGCWVCEPWRQGFKQGPSCLGWVLGFRPAKRPEAHRGGGRLAFVHKNYGRQAGEECLLITHRLQVLKD